MALVVFFCQKFLSWLKLLLLFFLTMRWRFLISQVSCLEVGPGLNLMVARVAGEVVVVAPEPVEVGRDQPGRVVGGQHR